MAPKEKTAEPADLIEDTATPPVEPEPALRAFKLRDGLGDADGEPVRRVSFGCSPRVSLGAGETFKTADPLLAAALAADPLLEETS
jgi:hypothetical protein